MARACVFQAKVVNGLFTVEVEFGATVFDGSGLDVQVAVKQHNPGEIEDCTPNVIDPYMPVGPPQPIHATPYAFHALSAPPGSSLDAPDGSPLDAMRVDNDGDVGIGTVPAAGEKLHVAGDARFDGLNGIGVRNPNNLGAIVRLSWLNDVPRIRLGGTSPGGAGGFDFQKIGDTSLLRILDNGNVGIGTATPLARLHVFRGASGATPLSTRSLTLEDDTDHFLQLLAPDAHSSGILFGNPTNGTAAAGVHFNSEVANGLSFRTGTNNVQMVVDASGNLGLGTTTPAQDLHVMDTAGTARVRVESAAGQAGISFMSDSTVENVIYSPSGSDDLRLFVNGADRLAITSAGNVGIGTTSPSEKLVVNGSIRVTGATGDDAVQVPDNSISAAETLEEPGLASDLSFSSVTLTETSVTLATRTITVPTDGFVIAHATAVASLECCIVVGDANVEMQINKATTPTNASVRYFTRVESQKIGTLSFHAVFAVSAGANTFTLTGRSTFNDCTAFNRRLTLIFFPTTYGTTDVED